MPGAAMRVDELALYYVIIAENSLKQRDAVLHDGEEFLRRFPASSYFTGIKSTMDVIIREKHEVEQGKTKVSEELARTCRPSSAGTCARWRASTGSRTSTPRRSGCSAPASPSVASTSSALPQLIQADFALGDWAAARRDLGRAGEGRSRDVSNDEGRI